MAQFAQFEEKEYEHPLNIELLNDTKNPLWTPGQVFEEHFGIDAAIMAGNQFFWSLFGYTNVPSGVVLNSFHWGYVWKRVGSPRMLPTFRTNLLIQTKRPEHRIGPNSEYRVLGIKGQYWQFRLTEHQQVALDRLCKKLQRRALVCYACGAFHTLADLYTHIDAHSLVDNSTFVRAEKMSSHSKWVYDKAGSSGIACSELEKIEDANFRELVRGIDGSDAGHPLQNLIELARAANETAEEIGLSNPIMNEFLRRRQLLLNNVEEFVVTPDISESVVPYLTFSLFCQLLNLNWLVVE